MTTTPKERANLRAMLADLPGKLKYDTCTIYGDWQLGADGMTTQAPIITGSEPDVLRAVVAAVNVLPRLLDEVERLQRIVERFTRPYENDARQLMNDACEALEGN